MALSFSLSISINDTVRKQTLNRSVTRVGRDHASDIVINDPTVSRHQFTIELHPESVQVEMNPASPNVMVRNGRPQMAGEFHSGEVFYVGPYRFELLAVADLPTAHRHINEDPAGPIDMSQLEEVDRLAPRWRSVVEASNSAQDKKPGEPQSAGDGNGVVPESEAPKISPFTMFALLVFLGFLGGYLTYEFWMPPGPAIKPLTVQFTEKDLLRAVRPIACQSKAECLERAKDSHRIAQELIQSSARDLVTLYKTAKLLHRAVVALGKDAELIPGLKAHYERAKFELETSFADHVFFYQRAMAEGQTKEQKQLLQNLLPICREDRQPFCLAMEQAYLRFPD